MKRIAFALASLAIAAAAHAQVTVSDPWVRATVPQQKATGLFMHIDAAQDVKDFIYDENADGVTFGNSRGVRNLFEQILTAQANRLAKMESFTKDDLMTLTRDDVLHARGMEDNTTVAELEAKAAEKKDE